MNDALLVRGRQRLRDLDAKLDRFADGKRSCGQPLAQRLALEELGDDEGRAVMDPHVVNREDVGMVEPRGRPGFLFEALEPVGVGTERLGDDFDGDIAREAGVACVIHLAHRRLRQRAQRFHTHRGERRGSGSLVSGKPGLYADRPEGLQLIPR